MAFLRNSKLWFGGVLLLAIQASCAGNVSSPRVVVPHETSTKVLPAVVVQPSEQVPVYVEDLSIGNPGAAVTIVTFLDVECPYCAKAWETVDRLTAKYTPDELRVVVKHLPLSFHQHAAAAAEAVIEVQRKHGQVAAASLLRTLFSKQAELSDSNIRSSATSIVEPNAPLAPTSITPNEQLQRDALLAQRLGIDGTPAFRVNGIEVIGAQPDAVFESIISSELDAAKQLVASGVAPGKVYARRVSSNLGTPKPSSATTPEPADTTRWAIPVGASPSMGPAAAPVVIVAFMDYQCPFCQRGFETLKQLRQKYPDSVRVVWKHRPLDFHTHADLASQIAIEAREQRGDSGFWSATDELFANQSSFASDDSDAVLKRISSGLGIDQAGWTKHAEVRAKVLTEDGDLAEDFDVGGTPQFFVNGLRVKGARPVEDFTALIDAELARASAQRNHGVAEDKLYATLTSDARPAPAPSRIDDALTLPDGPTLGPAKARVTIHVFSDYQCPFCQRADATLRGVLSKYPKQVRLVWHDLPLGFHDRARPAATLARAVRAHKGDAGFFELGQLLFENQSDLTEPALLRHAEKLGVKSADLEASHREATFGAAVDADKKLAAQLKVSGTPTFVVGRYLVEGAQPARQFERLIRRELAASNKR
jgi:protein-disulfide isomerase